MTRSSAAAPKESAIVVYSPVWLCSDEDGMTACCSSIGFYGVTLGCPDTVGLILGDVLGVVLGFGNETRATIRFLIAVLYACNAVNVARMSVLN